MKIMSIICFLYNIPSSCCKKFCQQAKYYIEKIEETLNRGMKMKMNTLT